MDDVYVVMTRLPGPDGDFVELEDANGLHPTGAKGFEWVDRPNGLVALRIPRVLAIRPGDLVERRDSDLDPREVVSVGRDWLTLDLLGKESPRLPLDNYVLYAMSEGSI